MYGFYANLPCILVPDYPILQFLDVKERQRAFIDFIFAEMLLLPE